jgi:hypothetical protein
MEKDKQGRVGGGSSCVGANLFKVELRVFNSPLWSMVPVPVPTTATAARKWRTKSSGPTSGMRRDRDLVFRGTMHLTADCVHNTVYNRGVGALGRQGASDLGRDCKSS